MELIKDKNPKLFSEYEGIIKNATERKLERNKPLDKFVDDFIEAFRTVEERKLIKELTYQIESAINFICMQKENMLKDIDLSYTYSSHLLAITTARAKAYFKAIDRVEEYYKNSRISNYLKEYKNL
jgi:hypothetical protein